MKNVFKFKDQESLYIIIISMLLLFCHVYQFIDSGYMIEPLIRVIYYFVEILVLYFFGIKSIPYLLAPFGLILTLFIKFDNYTPFVLIISAILIKHEKKFTFINLILYTVCVFVVCTLHDKSAIHIAAHFLGCIFLTLCGRIIFLSGALKFYNEYKENFKRDLVNNFFDSGKLKYQNLDLTPDEYFILHEIVINKKPFKAIGKPNTISVKIQKCYKKNNFDSPEELYKAYLKMIENQTEISTNQ